MVSYSKIRIQSNSKQRYHHSLCWQVSCMTVHGAYDIKWVISQEQWFSNIRAYPESPGKPFLQRCWGGLTWALPFKFKTVWRFVPRKVVTIKFLTVQNSELAKIGLYNSFSSLWFLRAQRISRLRQVWPQPLWLKFFSLMETHTAMQRFPDASV